MVFKSMKFWVDSFFLPVIWKHHRTVSWLAVFLKISRVYVPSLFFECNILYFPCLTAFKTFCLSLVSLFPRCIFLCVCVCVCLKFIDLLGSVSLVYSKFGKYLLQISSCSPSSNISSLLLVSSGCICIFCCCSQFLRYGWIWCCFQWVCSCWSQNLMKYLIK